MTDPNIFYDAGWDRVEDDHFLSEWYVGLDGERNDDHPGHHRDGKFARDRAKDLNANAASHAGIVRSSAAATTKSQAPSAPARADQRPGAMDSRTESRLRANLKKEAKLRGVSPAIVWKQRQGRFAAGEAIADITDFPPSATAARRPSPSPTMQVTGAELDSSVEGKLRTNLNVEAKRRKVPKAQVWSERLRRYRQGERITSIVSEPKRSPVAAPRQSKRTSAPKEYGRPLYRSPSQPLPMCLACGSPQVSCRC